MKKNTTKENKKITKLENLNQIDGRDMNRESQASNLDVLLGATGLGKYGTLDKDEYIRKLDSFNTSELRNHAIKAGLIPIANISRLKKQLITDFDKYSLAFKHPNQIQNQDISKDKRDSAMKILSVLK